MPALCKSRSPKGPRPSCSPCHYRHPVTWDHCIKRTLHLCRFQISRPCAEPEARIVSFQALLVLFWLPWPCFCLILHRWPFPLFFLFLFPPLLPFALTCLCDPALESQPFNFNFFLSRGRGLHILFTIDPTPFQYPSSFAPLSLAPLSSTGRQP